MRERKFVGERRGEKCGSLVYLRFKKIIIALDL